MTPFLHTGHGATPIVVSVVHAGRAYPHDIAQRMTVPLDRAVALEDRHADRLVTAAAAAGHQVLIAQVPRLMIDLNRGETDLDPAGIVGAQASGRPVSARARGGLGLLPSRLAGVGALWRAPVSPAEVTARIAAWHRPYHDALAAALDVARARHGRALLIDVHSMPPLGGVDLVVGTGFGTTARADVIARTIGWWRDRGLRCRVDNPYAGGHVITRHGRPGEAIDALQLEFDRRLYLDASLSDTGSGLPALSASIAAYADTMALTGSMPLAEAAE